MSGPTHLIQPPLSAASPIGSLSGWRLILHCQHCGPRRREISKPTEEKDKSKTSAIRRDDHLIRSQAIYATPIGKIFKTLDCPVCHVRPERLEAECVWITLPDDARIDLSWLLPKRQKPAEPEQPRQDQPALL